MGTYFCFCSCCGLCCHSCCGHTGCEYGAVVGCSAWGDSCCLCGRAAVAAGQHELHLQPARWLAAVVAAAWHLGQHQQLLVALVMHPWPEGPALQQTWALLLLELQTGTQLAG